MDKSLAGTEARETDPASFDAFYQAEHAALFRSLLLLTGERAEAEDVAHEAFVRVLERWDRVARMEAPRAYLFRIALNLHRNTLRRNWRRARRAIIERGVARYGLDGWKVMMAPPFESARSDYEARIRTDDFLAVGVDITIEYLELPRWHLRRRRKLRAEAEAKYASRFDEPAGDQGPGKGDPRTDVADRIEVVIDRPAFEGEAEAVEEAFAGLDADVTVESAYEVRGAGDYPWIVFVTLSGTVAVFLKKITELAAEDAYAALKRWVRSVAAARRRFRSTNGTIQVRDGRVSRIVLHEDLPDEAFMALLAMDLDALPDGACLVWDADVGEWKNV